MGKLKEAGKDYVEFWKDSPVVTSFATLVFVGALVFFLVITPMMVVNHVKLSDQCKAKGGVVLKTPDGWACFEDKVRVKA